MIFTSLYGIVDDCFANTQPREETDICPTNDREWSDFSIYLDSFAAGALSERRRREFAGGGKNQRMPQIVGTNVFEGQISVSSLSVYLHPIRLSPSHSSIPISFTYLH